MVPRHPLFPLITHPTCYLAVLEWLEGPGRALAARTTESQGLTHPHVAPPTPDSLLSRALHRSVLLNRRSRHLTPDTRTT